MKLYIKNMVCPRCIASVNDLMESENIALHSVQLGEVETVENLKTEQIATLEVQLQKLGFELLNDPASRLIEQVKSILIQKVQNGMEEHFSVQKFLTTKIFKDYSSVSKLFSEVEGITIEQFLILQKIEKVKELLIYNELSLSEIGAFLGYSSGQHLSSQFKRMTGMTPTEFKSLGNHTRKPLDNVS